MKTLKFFLFALVATLSAFRAQTSAPAAAPAAPPPEKLELTLFGSRTCAECMEIKEKLLKPLEAQYPDLKVHYRVIEDDQDFRLMLAMEKDYKVAKPSPQELYFPDRVLLGYETIMQEAPDLIEDYLGDPAKWRYAKAYGSAATVTVPTKQEAIKQRVSSFTMIGLFAAGFVDGINPCAIGTMIFLISFLGAKHRNRAEILKIGLSFTGTVFITYFAIGLGAFRILSLLEQMYWVALAVRVFAMVLAVTVAVMSLWDAYWWYKTHDTERMQVQLPKPVKLLIHSVIRGNLSSNKIVVGAVVSGFLVTLLAGVCTAKIYLPTIVLMTQAVGFRLFGWVLLVFYNFLFVLPLLIVLTAAAYGLKWQRLSAFTQKHLAGMKVLLAIVLLGLAIFIATEGLGK